MLRAHLLSACFSAGPREHSPKLLWSPLCPPPLQVANGSLHPATPPDCHPALAELLVSIFSPDPLERPSFGLIVARLEAVLYDVRMSTAAVQGETLLGRWLKGASHAAAASAASLSARSGRS